MKKLFVLIVLILSANSFSAECQLKAWPRNDIGKISVFPFKTTKSVEVLDECVLKAEDLVQKEWTEWECSSIPGREHECFDVRYYYKHVYYTFVDGDEKIKGKVRK